VELNVTFIYAPLVLRFFCFNAPCQHTPLFNLCPLVFGLTPTDCLGSITLTPAYSVISYRNVIFDLRLFLFTTTLFRRTTTAKKGLVLERLFQMKLSFYQVELYCKISAFSNWGHRQFSTHSLSCFYAIDGKG
jgi:hypothetical protein